MQPLADANVAFRFGATVIFEEFEHPVFDDTHVFGVAALVH
jgi:hypothetical protein